MVCKWSFKYSRYFSRITTLDHFLYFPFPYRLLKKPHRNVTDKQRDQHSIRFTESFKQLIGELLFGIELLGSVETTSFQMTNQMKDKQTRPHKDSFLFSVLTLGHTIPSSLFYSGHYKIGIETPTDICRPCFKNSNNQPILLRRIDKPKEAMFLRVEIHRVPTIRIFHLVKYGYNSCERSIKR